MQETIYRSFQNNKWEFWTHVLGQTIYLSEEYFHKMKRQGAKVILVKTNP